MAVHQLLSSTITSSPTSIALYCPQTYKNVMKRILQCIKTRISGVQRVRIWSAPSRPCLPALPAEIWLIILELAIRPSLITDLEFEPSQIDLGLKCLAWESYSNKDATEKSTIKASRSFRSVCSLWKDLVDRIDLITPWVLDDHLYWPSPAASSHKSLPTNTKNYIRLNRAITVVGRGDNGIKFRYSHPIPTFSLTFHCDMSTQACLASLHDIVSFPNSLRVFNLYINGVQLEKGVLKEIQTNLQVLTTLRLCLPAYLITESLELPNVVSLFLSILRSGTVSVRTNLSTLRWKLPNLRNLLLEDHRLFPDLWKPIKTEPFFYELIHSHIDSIQSLCISPITEDITDIDSPISWLRMTRLKALAANFDHARIAVEDKLTFGPQSTSVRYLIQTRTNVRTLDFREKMRYFIDACPHLVAVTLSVSCARNPRVQEVSRNTYRNFPLIFFVRITHT
jgi:hypothetical protein